MCFMHRTLPRRPPVHAKVIGKILFGKMLNAVFPNIGPHKNAQSTVSGIYLLR